MRAEGALGMRSSERGVKWPITVTVLLGLVPYLLGRFLPQSFMLLLALQQ